jgi:hypothetical protein
VNLLFHPSNGKLHDGNKKRAFSIHGANDGF